MPKFTAFRRNFWETGRGAILIGAEWDEKIPTWPLLLKNRAIIWDILIRYGRQGIRVMQESEEVPMHIVLQEVNSMDFPSTYLAGPEELRR